MPNSFVDQIARAAVHFGIDQRIVSVNAEFQRVFQSEQWLNDDNCDWTQLIVGLVNRHQPQPDIQVPDTFAANYVANIIGGRTVPDIATGDGDCFRGTAILLSDGGWVWCLNDVTYLREHELQDRQFEKMEAISRLAGGISHDFNNLMTIIQGNLELIEETSEADSKIATWARTGLRATARGAELSQRLLGVAGRRSFQPTAVQLRSSAERLMSRAEPVLDESIHINLSIPADLPPIFVDSGYLDESLLNLIVNARDAMPDGGEIEMKASLEDGASGPLGADSDEIIQDQHVLLTVSDQGIGMTRDVLEHAFDPFFTTKSKESGSGLGLSTVYGFAQKSGGSARIVSTPGTGAKVMLTLPVAGMETEVQEPADALPRAAPHEHILLVDDEDEVRETAAEILTGLGYAVTQADSGDRALEILDAGSEFSLVFSDIVMPGTVDGEGLAQIVRASYPQIPVLLASGYRESADSAASLGLKVLPKPYSRHSLADEIRKILDQK